jgi:quercetin dioxygenase-like cupin family protein
MDFYFLKCYLISWKCNSFSIFGQMENPMGYKYFSDVKVKVIFSTEGPQPQSLCAEDEFKIITAGLEAGQKIPIHPEGLAIYSFLEGKGWMVVDGERLVVGPGAVVITQAGTQRGIEADSRLIFIATRFYTTFQRPREIL